MRIIDFTFVLVSCLSAFFDLVTRRIPNWLIAIGAMTGLAINAFQGGHFFLHSLLGFVVGIAVLVMPFAMGWIGAGDVKFFGVMGAQLGIVLLPRVFLYSAIVAGVIALASLFSGKISFFSFQHIWLDVKIAIVSMGKIIPPPVRERVAKRDESVPWGVAIAVGSLIAYYLDPDGQWAGF
ncbi:MAG: A24 family peptidase [Candidatus Binatia bacterium]